MNTIYLVTITSLNGAFVHGAYKKLEDAYEYVQKCTGQKPSSLTEGHSTTKHYDAEKKLTYLYDIEETALMDVTEN